MPRTSQTRSSPELFRWITSGDEFFRLLVAEIDSAQSSIRLESYIFTDSPIGEKVKDSLTAAFRRGVEVKVLLDGWGSLFLNNLFWEPLLSLGADIRWFNPLSLRRYGIRNHRKLLVADESKALVGGFNIAPEWLGDGIHQGWRDLGMKAHGPVAKELSISFETMFAMADFRHKRFTRIRKAMLRESVRTSDGQLLLSGPGRGQNHFRDSILDDLATTRDVRIMAAYFLPSRPIRRAIWRCARRGCKVQIILAGKSDVRLSQLASRRFYQGMLGAGIEIYEYQPQILHAKLILIDDIVYTGSANLDRRSIYINYELMLRIQNKRLGSEARSFFDADLLQSHRIETAEWKKSRTIWAKLLERWAFLVLARFDPLIARRQLKNLR